MAPTDGGSEHHDVVRWSQRSYGRKVAEDRLQWNGAALHGHKECRIRSKMVGDQGRADVFRCYSNDGVQLSNNTLQTHDYHHHKVKLY